MKAIPGEFQHALMVADMDKEIIRKVARGACVAEKYKIIERFDQEMI